MKAFVARMSMRARILWGAAIVLVVVVVLILNGRGKSNTSNTYQTVPVQRGELTATVGATGSVRAVQSATLNWQTSGTVAQVNVKVGDTVKKGDVLATLDLSTVPQSIIQAQANLVTAQKALQDAHSSTASAQSAINLKNAQDAYKKAYDYRASLNGKQWIEEVIITYVGGQQVPIIKWHKGYPDAKTIQDADNELALKKAQLDDAQRTYDRLQNGPNPDDIAAAQANVDAAQATLNMARIVAPIDGTVTQAGSLPGDLVGSSQSSSDSSAASAVQASGSSQSGSGGVAATGQTAFRIDNLSNLLVDVDVSEVDINSVAVGQPATLSLDAIPGKTYHGVVQSVSQAGDNSSGSVNFTVAVQLTDADTEVKPAMTAAVNIVVQQVKDQLLVPNRAVRLVDAQRVVYILENGKPKQVQISLGASSDTMSVVAGGNLKEGDLVILNPPAANFGPGGGPVVRSGGG
jgi:HlyD family secretion protein